MKNMNANNATINHKDIPKGWQPVVLGDFINTKHGYAFKGKNIVKEPMKDILVTPGNFRIGGGFKNSKFKYFNGEYPKSYILKENDIIVTMTDLSKDGDTLGYSAKVPKSNNEEKYLHNQRIGLVEFLNDKIDKDFIYWLLRTKDYHGFIVSAATGTSIRHTSPTTIKEYEFFLPPLPEQKTIVSVLSSLDDKIDLLHRQNKTLEAMAETLFRQWFIEEAKEDWEEKPLDEIADYLNGLACQKFPFENDVDRLPVLKIKELRNGFTKNSDWVTSKVLEQYIVKNGDVIFSWSGSLLVKIWNGKNCVLNQHLFKVTSEKYPKWFYYFWTKHHLQKFISIAESKATTMGHIKRGDLHVVMVLVPSKEETEEMGIIMDPIVEKLIKNTKQICTLEQLRDTLLPKLMSGVVRMKI